MNFSHCPYMARLSNELIEAYRRIEDQDDLLPVRADSPDEITTIHHRMADHRQFCPICHRFANLAAEMTTEGSLRPN